MKYFSTKGVRLFENPFFVTIGLLERKILIRIFTRCHVKRNFGYKCGFFLSLLIWTECYSIYFNCRVVLRCKIIKSRNEKERSKNAERKRNNVFNRRINLNFKRNELHRSFDFKFAVYSLVITCLMF